MHLPTQIRLLVLVHVFLIGARSTTGSVTRSYRRHEEAGARSQGNGAATNVHLGDSSKLRSYRTESRRSSSRLENGGSGDYEGSFSRTTLKFDNDRSGGRRSKSTSRGGDFMSYSRTSKSLQEAVMNLRSSEDYRNASRRSRSAEGFVEQPPDFGAEGGDEEIGTVEGPAEKTSKMSRIKAKSRNAFSSLNRFRKSTPGKVVIGGAAAGTALAGTAAVVTAAGGAAAVTAATAGGAALLFC